MIPERLETANLEIRPFAVGDGSAVYAYWKSDPGWQRFNASVPPGFSKKDADDFVAGMTARDRSEQPNWALVHDHVVVGVVSLTFEQDHRVAVLGYGIHANLRGRGLCAEAAEAVLDSAFASAPELQSIRAHTDAKNRASIRVLNKLGFSEKRVPSGTDPSHGEVVFNLTRAEWGA